MYDITKTRKLMKAMKLKNAKQNFIISKFSIHNQ